MSYSFLRESKLYLVYGGTKYNIRTTSAITFNQTFAEDAYSVKTLHDQSKMFEGTTITKANPAVFSFSVPLTQEKDESLVIDLITDLVATSESDIELEQQLNNTYIPMDVFDTSEVMKPNFLSHQYNEPGVKVIKAIARITPGIA